MTRTTRAIVHDSYLFATGGIDLSVGMQEVDERGFPVRTDAILTLQETSENAWPEQKQSISLNWKWLGDGESNLVTPDYPHILRLPEGVGQAMLEALARHYHGTSDTHRMANDLGRERQRRDQAEDRLWSILDRVTTGMYMESNADPIALALAQNLPAIGLAINRTPPPVGNPPMMYHQSTEFGQCRGHMPWDFGDECR